MIQYNVPACRVNAKPHMQKIKKSVVVIQFSCTSQQI